MEVMDNILIKLMKTGYGITPNKVIPASRGFSAKAAYRVVGADGKQYFLKVYDKTLPTTRCFVERIDAYMPVLAWLSGTPGLAGRILTPALMQGGTYKIEQEDEAYVLFEFICGTTPGIQGITRDQTAELAEILAHLHELSESVPFELTGLDEDISLPFCGHLAQFLKSMNTDGALFAIVSPYTGLLKEAIDETIHLRDTLRTGYAPLVLCHTDAHGNNVIQGERLVLVDWEELRLAPAEADLFIHILHPYGKLLLEEYCGKRRNFSINQELLRFYTLRRRLEDLWGDIQRLTEESPDEAEADNLLGYVKESIDGVYLLYRKGET